MLTQGNAVCQIPVEICLVLCVFRRCCGIHETSPVTACTVSAVHNIPPVFGMMIGVYTDSWYIISWRWGKVNREECLCGGCLSLIGLQVAALVDRFIANKSRQTHWSQSVNKLPQRHTSHTNVPTQAVNQPTQRHTSHTNATSPVHQTTGKNRNCIIQQILKKTLTNGGIDAIIYYV